MAGGRDVNWDSDLDSIGFLKPVGSKSKAFFRSWYCLESGYLAACVDSDTSVSTMAVVSGAIVHGLSLPFLFYSGTIFQ